MKSLKKKKYLVLILSLLRKNVNTKGEKKINEFFNFNPIQYDSDLENFRILQSWKII